MEELRLARNLSLDKIKTSNKKLQDAVANDRRRCAERYFKEVTEHFTRFEDVHVQYVMKSKGTLEDPDNQEKFFTASEVVDAAGIAWDAYEDNNRRKDQMKAKTAEEAVEKARLQKARGIEKASILAEFEELLAMSALYGQQIDEEENSVNKSALSQEVLYLEDRMKKARISADKYMDEVEVGEAENMLGEKNKAERDFRGRLYKVKSFVHEDTGGSLGTASNSSSRSSSPSGHSNRDSSFRYKKMEFPKFNGIIRNYATFKRDFQDIVVEPQCYDRKHMSHILRHECLSGEAKNLVHNLHDYDALWAKLNDKYDDESEVVEQISNQIASLRKVEEEDYDGFVKLVDVIERANLDMTATGSTAVLNNPVTVRLILQKCPKGIREGLAKELSTKKPKEEYECMLKFLIARRKESMRLARLQEAQKPQNSQPRGQQKAKGSTNAADGKKGESKGSWKKDKDKDKSKGNYNCTVPGCVCKVRHFLSDCRAFKKLDVHERGKIVLAQKLCVICFNTGHDGSNCPKKALGWKECDTDQCGKWHSRLLHGCVVPGLALATKANNVGSGSKTLLLAQDIPTVNGENITTLWDTGSTISLVSTEFAEGAGLAGVDCCFELSGVGETKQLYSTKLYLIPLYTTEGTSISVHAFGIDRITADLEPTDVLSAAEAFELKLEQLQRPVGKVQLLVGMNYTDILPVQTEVKKKVALYSSKFGTGYLVGGTLEADVDGGEQLDTFAHTVCHAGGRTLKPVDFLTAETFGVDIPRRCRYCRGCRECGFRARQLTYTEATELSVIEKGLTLDTVKKVWTAEYPFATDPSILKNNYSQAYACMSSLEKRLAKYDQTSQFNEQFDDAVSRGVFRELSKDEADSYTGPINYISITETYKEGENVTTPLRLCMNSSMKYQGISLNDILLKGPSALNNIFSVLLNFRTYPVAFVKDISKFYQSVKASLRDQHVRRVIWRGGKTDEPPKIYATDCVNFGDKPAGCIALTCVRETAELYSSIDPEAAQKLKDDGYVDDVASGAEDEEAAKRVSMNMNKIVEMGGFKFKSTVMSGDAGDPRRVLGTGWDTEKDQLFIEVKVNTSAKRKGLRTEPNIAFDEIKANFPKTITKRIIWRVVLGQFDLLGLASVFFVRLKLLMRDLSGEEGQKIGWDTPLSEDLRIRFMDILEMMGGIQTLRFPRCIKPAGIMAGIKPDLLVFGDGSKQAFCSLAYVRWHLTDGGFRCFLISGKTRVAPLKKISIPRLELLGSVASVRLAASIQESLSFEFGKRYFFTDSSCVFGMIRGECGAFQEFIGTRTGEIKSKSDPSTEWFWVPTQHNLADLGTRNDVTPAVLHPDSQYLNGTDWMRDVFEAWPVSQSPGGKIPEEEMSTTSRVSLAVSVTQPLLNVKKYKSFEQATRIMALICKGADKFKLRSKNVNQETANFITRKYRNMAENILFFQAQQGYEMKTFTSLSPRMQQVQLQHSEEELMMVSGRLGNALAVGYDKEELPVLDYKAPIARLVMLGAHERDHGGVDRTLQRSRNVAWIANGRRLAKAITRACFTCKLRNKELEKQIMAPLPASRIPPAPVFASTAVDLFGPIEIRDTVKRRTSKKAWGVLFCCTKTSAVHIEVTEDYSCDSFLLSLRRFINLRGVPSRIQSDPGSQLMAAAKQLGTWDFSRITEWAAGVQTEWYTIPTDSQHHNGMAESLIKSTKKQLTSSLKDRKFTKGELDTLVSNIAYIINSRPLMKKAGEDPLSGGPITPLHLLGGRSTINIPNVRTDGDPKLTRRLRFIEDTTQEFWSKWFAQVFHSLVPSYKWKTETRNVLPGDIVLLKESNQLKAEYKLAKVKTADPGPDGKVRRVTLIYKNLKPTGTCPKKADKDLKGATFSETDRCIQNIIVIVPSDYSPEDIDAAVTSGIGL